MKIFLSALAMAVMLISCTQKHESERVQDFNFGWQFALSNDSNAWQNHYNDKDWQKLDLPHDWSVSFPFDTLKGEGCTGYLPGGIGWYRKHFKANVTADEKLYVLFDGVYNNSEVWINGHYLGSHPYGYSPFYYDLTPYLKADNNVIAVKVDRSRYADSRWYTGSGIYRNVQLIRTNKLHIPVWGTFVSSKDVSAAEATVLLELSVNNDFDDLKHFRLETDIISPNGAIIGTESDVLEMPGESTHKTTQSIKVSKPALWSVDQPHLYKAITKIIDNGRLVDRYETTFGIRSIHFDAEKGFFLNGQNMKIKGVCLHHDGGLVGAAVPKEVWRRRLQTLKEGGCNAIRISHNPSSDELLDLCDEMGFLVQDEFFDEWDYPKDKRLNMNQSLSTDYITRGYTEHFQEWAERDLKATILAHRNHPSIFQWSIGNEIEWTYPRNKKATGFWDADWSGNYFWSPTPLSPQEIKQRYDGMAALEHNIGATAQKLARWTKEMDTTRPVIANCILPSASYVTGYADALDIIGFSYRRVMYDYGHKYFPDKPLMGTENLGQYHEWKAIMERDFISGTFLWTGVDYMGEAHHHNKNDLRRKGTHSGLLDFAGFKKPSYYMMKSLWNEHEPTLYMSTQSLDQSIYKLDNKNVVEKKKGAWQQALWFWHKVNDHWNYKADEMVVVEIISNCQQVELFLNDKSLGVKNLHDFDDRIYKWAVPFKAGKLEAKAVFKQMPVEKSLVTAQAVAAIDINADKTKLTADNYDVAHVSIQLLDADGNPVKQTDEPVSFAVKGAVKALGVDNGDCYNLEPYQSNTVTSKNGRALLIVQAGTVNGLAKITASANGIKSKELHISIE